MTIRIHHDLALEKTQASSDGTVYRVTATVTDAPAGTADPPLYSIAFLWSKNSGKAGLVAGAQKALAEAKATEEPDPVIAAVIAGITTEDLMPAKEMPAADEPAPMRVIIEGVKDGVEIPTRAVSLEAAK